LHGVLLKITPPPAGTPLGKGRNYILFLKFLPFSREVLGVQRKGMGSG